MSIYGATDCPLSFYGRKIICGHDIELKVQLAAGVRGAARMKLHGDRAPLRSASKHRATTFIPWDWEACRHQEGEKIKLQGKQYRAGENRRGGTSGGLWKKKRERWQHWWGTRNGPSHKTARPPPSSFLILLLVPSETSVVCCPTYWFKCVCDEERG